MLKHGYIRETPTAIIDTPRIVEKPILHMDGPEVLDLIEAAETGESLTKRQAQYHRNTQTRDLAMLTLMLGTGIRVSECINLNLQDLDTAHRSFRVTRKGGKQAILYYSEDVERAISDYLVLRQQAKPLPGHQDALFLSLQNRRITARAVENLVKKYAQAAVPLKKITPHKLRSTFGTALYQATGDIYLVADVLGHSDVNTTRKHYADMSEENRRKAAVAVHYEKTDH
jgi:site-specific recombinase XerD